MTRLEKKIDDVTKKAGVELTRTTIGKISDEARKYIEKAFEAGMDYAEANNDSVPDLKQWLEENKL